MSGFGVEGSGLRVEGRGVSFRAQARNLKSTDHPPALLAHPRPRRPVGPTLGVGGWAFGVWVYCSGVRGLGFDVGLFF